MDRHLIHTGRGTVNEKQQFHRMLAAMEEEGDVPPLDSALEERLVARTLHGIRAQRSRRRWAAAAGAVAMAACLALIVLLRSGAGTVPAYEASLVGDGQVLGMGAPSSPRPRFAPDAILSVEMRPQESAPESTQVRAFFRQTGRLLPWKVNQTRTANGVFRIQAPLRELSEVQTGPAELLLMVGNGSEPEKDALSHALQRELPPQIQGWQLLRLPFEVVSH